MILDFEKSFLSFFTFFIFTTFQGCFHFLKMKMWGEDRARYMSPTKELWHIPEQGIDFSDYHVSFFLF